MLTGLLKFASGGNSRSPAEDGDLRRDSTDAPRVTIGCSQRATSAGPAAAGASGAWPRWIRFLTHLSTFTARLLGCWGGRGPEAVLAGALRRLPGEMRRELAGRPTRLASAGGAARCPAGLRGDANRDQGAMKVGKTPQNTPQEEPAEQEELRCELVSEGASRGSAALLASPPSNFVDKSGIPHGVNFLRSDSGLRGTERQ